MSPRHQISCTSSRSTSDKTASRAWRLPWMSERTAMRMRRSAVRRCRPAGQAIAEARRSARRAGVGRVVGATVLGQVLDALARLPLGVVVLHRVDELAHELRRQVDAGDDDAGDLLVLDLVVDAGERDGELVLRVAD